MKALNISRMCLVNTLMLGLVIAYSLWAPVKMNIAMAERHVGADCEGECWSERTTTCSDNGNNNGVPCPTTETYSECYGEGTKKQHPGSENCTHEECELVKDCYCYNS